MKNYLFLFVLTLISVSLSARDLPASQTDWEYTEVTIDGQEGISLDLYKGNRTRIDIPTSIDNKKVLALCYEKKNYAGLFNQNNFTHNTTIESVEGYNNGLLVVGSATFTFCKHRRFSVTLPNSVKELGSFSFAASNISKFRFPTSLTKIGANLFSGCDNLRWLSEIPNHVENIPDNAFLQCNDLFMNLSDLLHSNIQRIGGHAFSGCRNLRGNFHLNKLTHIGSYAFQGCSNLTGNLILPNTLVEMKYSAFQDCSGFDGSLSLSSKLTKLSVGVFKGCTNITGDIIIPSSVHTIESVAFDDCRGINGSLSLPDGLREIGEAAFRNTQISGELRLPEQLRKIDSQTFRGCKNLTKGSIIPNSIRSISNDAFHNSKAYRKNIILPDNTSSIGYYAFSGNVTQGAREIKSITLPATFFSLAETAFLGTTKTLRSITVMADEPPFIRKWIDKRFHILKRKSPDEVIVFDDIAYDNATLFVPKTHIEAYRNDSFWGKFKTIKEIVPTGIGEKVIEKPYQVLTSKRSLHIMSPSKINQINLYDMSGRLIRSYFGNHDYINIEQNNRGLVIIKIQCKDGSIFTEKLI
ncbi:leucine-rich repeat domain-containing protein [Prolixibacteraceae bacterium]|nr:leucine-rich repeat domain-containing protein [Prolixibacteraceae bacterium]